MRTEVYEAQFVKTDAGWRISEAVVAGHGSSYRRSNDEYESLQLVWVITGVLLGRWDEDLWQQVQRHRTNS